jgi:hypothetical protein
MTDDYREDHHRREWAKHRLLTGPNLAWEDLPEETREEMREVHRLFWGMQEDFIMECGDVSVHGLGR